MNRVVDRWILFSAVAILANFGTVAAAVAQTTEANSQSETNAADALDQAMERADWQQVVTLLEPKVSPIRQETAESDLYRMGLAHYQLDHVKPALQYLREAFKRNRGSSPTVEMLAEMASRARDDQTLDSCLEHAPNNARVVTWYAMRLLRKGDPRRRTASCLRNTPTTAPCSTSLQVDRSRSPTTVRRVTSCGKRSYWDRTRHCRMWSSLACTIDWGTSERRSSSCCWPS